MNNVFVCMYSCMYACMYALPMWHVGVFLCGWMGGCLNKDIIAKFYFTRSIRSGGQTPSFEFRTKVHCFPVFPQHYYKMVKILTEWIMRVPLLGSNPRLQNKCFVSIWPIEAIS